MARPSDDWVHERTLTARSARFWWRLDEDGSLAILRVRSSLPGRKHQLARAFSRDDLEQLLDFMADGEWHRLAARTSALRAKPSPSGIAAFLFHTLKRGTSESLLAPHLAVVLTHAGLWEWDGRRGHMHFRQVSSDLGRLAAHFAGRQADPGPRLPDPRVAPRRRPRHPAPGHSPPAFDLAATFRGRAAELRGRLEAVGGSAHRSAKGQRREAAFRDFLRRRLPAPYGVGHGEVAASWGEISRQIDILIYDLRAPLLLDEGGSIVLATESVYAAIEVKPLLHLPFLREAAETIRSVKALRPVAVPLPSRGGALWPPPSENPPIFGAVLACHSIEPELLARRLRQIQQDVPPRLWVDCICVLGKAVIHRVAGDPGPAGWRPEETDAPTPLACVEAGDDSLLYFHTLLLQDLKAKPFRAPQLIEYAQGMRFPEPKLF